MALSQSIELTPPVPSEEVTGPTHESDALRLRRALQRLRLNLQEADGEVIQMLEDWQQAAEACEKAEQKAAKLRAQAADFDADAVGYRHKAAYSCTSTSASPHQTWGLGPRPH